MIRALYGHMLPVAHEGELTPGNVVLTACGIHVTVKKGKPKVIVCGRCVELLKKAHEGLQERHRRTLRELVTAKNKQADLQRRLAHYESRYGQEEPT